MTNKKVNTPGSAKRKDAEPVVDMSFEEAMIMFNKGTMEGLKYIMGLLQEILRRLPDPDEKKVIML